MGDHLLWPHHLDCFGGGVVQGIPLISTALLASARVVPSARGLTLAGTIPSRTGSITGVDLKHPMIVYCSLLMTTSTFCACELLHHTGSEYSSVDNTRHVDILSVLAQALHVVPARWGRDAPLDVTLALPTNRCVLKDCRVWLQGKMGHLGIPGACFSLEWSSCDWLLCYWSGMQLMLSCLYWPCPWLH